MVQDIPACPRLPSDTATGRLIFITLLSLGFDRYANTELLCCNISEQSFNNILCQNFREAEQTEAVYTSDCKRKMDTAHHISASHVRLTPAKISLRQLHPSQRVCVCVCVISSFFDLLIAVFGCRLNSSHTHQGPSVCVFV